MNTTTIQAIRDFAVEAEDLQNKAEKKLLEINTGRKFEDKFHAFFSKKLKDLDEQSALEFKRDFATKQTRWTVLTHTIYNFYDIKHGSRLITPRKEFIERVLSRNKLNLPNTGFVPKGRKFAARELLRDIISSAKSEVILLDSYFHPEMLRFLGEILDEGLSINIRILTHDTKNTRLVALKDALKLFIHQYPNTILEAKAGDIPHDRYIVLDVTRLFHFGSSFHDFGGRDSSWSEKIDINEIKQTLGAIDKHFVDSKDIIST